MHKPAGQRVGRGHRLPIGARDEHAAVSTDVCCPGGWRRADRCLRHGREVYGHVDGDRLVGRPAGAGESHQVQGQDPLVGPELLALRAHPQVLGPQPANAGGISVRCCQRQARRVQTKASHWVLALASGSRQGVDEWLWRLIRLVAVQQPWPKQGQVVIGGPHDLNMPHRRGCRHVWHNGERKRRHGVCCVEEPSPCPKGYCSHYSESRREGG
mmetsp:Transcript_128250/g.356980  ORF Transcript_128250/g.356980 Transcript_128250/m.356980 type:complete len:213 (-) Transcript_128250:248-886(-)